jgi:hypothetical protein
LVLFFKKELLSILCFFIDFTQSEAFAGIFVGYTLLGAPCVLHSGRSNTCRPGFSGANSYACNIAARAGRYSLQRSFENNLPFVTAARGSTTALALLNHGDGQYALSIDTGITDVMLAVGRNDIEQFSMAATQVEANVQAVATRYVNAGKRVWCFTIPPTTYSNDAWTTVSNQSFPFAAYATGATVTSAGATTITLTSVSNLLVGMSVALNASTNIPAQAVAPGTVITSINVSSSSVTISTPTVNALPASTKLYFGAALAGGSALETQRLAYNAFARANWKSAGSACTGLIDIDAIVADQGGSGKWRTDLGQASADGVHPSSVLHQAVVNAGVLSPSRFTAP